jgi:antitoxin Phd
MTKQLVAQHRRARQLNTLDDLSMQCDALLVRMQTPKARKGMKAAFNAPSAQLGRAAVKAARKRH